MMSRPPPPAGPEFEGYKLGHEIGLGTWEHIGRSLDELHQLTIGLGFDPGAKNVFLDLTAIGKEGSALANQMAEPGGLKNSFSGFQIREAPLWAAWASKAAPEDIGQTLDWLHEKRDNAIKNLESQKTRQLTPEQVDALKVVINDLCDAAEQTAKAGSTDGGMSLLTGPKAATLVFASRAAGTDKLDKALKELLDIAGKEQPEIAKVVKLNAESLRDIHFHVAQIPLPPEEVRLRELVGENLEVVVGVGQTAVYLAAGRDALKTLKQAIEKSAAEGPRPALPLQASLCFGPIMTMLGQGPPQAKTANLAKPPAQGPAKDHINLSCTPLPYGMRCRLELEEGAIQAIGQWRPAPSTGPQIKH